LSYIFLKNKEGRKGESERGALASPLKQILVILAFIIYKILKKTLVL
jgi:hypothetical protein